MYIIHKTIVVKLKFINYLRTSNRNKIKIYISSFKFPRLNGKAYVSEFQSLLKRWWEKAKYDIKYLKSI